MADIMDNLIKRTSEVPELFVWSKRHRSRLFPIDPSYNDLQQSWNMSTRDVSFLSKFPALRRRLLELLGPIEDHVDETPPLPLETEPLLHYLRELLKDEKYHSDLMNGIDQADEESINQLVYDLCLKLDTYIKTAPSNETTFLKRVLFTNPNFDQVVVDNLWETVIQNRLQQLRQLAKQVPFENQVDILRDCLLALDRSMINLSTAVSEESPETSQGSEALQSLLDSLLVERKPCLKETFRTKYYLKNSILENGQTLHDAFTYLSRPSMDQPDRNTILPLAQKHYLADLIDTIPKSKFESSYLRLDQYLNSYTEKIDQAQLEQLIEKRFLQRCISQINGLISRDTTLPAFTPELQNLEYLAHLIDHLIDVKLDESFSRYGELFSWFSHYYWVKRAMGYQEGIDTLASYQHALDQRSIKKSDVPSIMYEGKEPTHAHTLAMKILEACSSSFEYFSSSPDPLIDYFMKQSPSTEFTSDSPDFFNTDLLTILQNAFTEVPNLKTQKAFTEDPNTILQNFFKEADGIKLQEFFEEDPSTTLKELFMAKSRFILPSAVSEFWTQSLKAAKQLGFKSLFPYSIEETTRAFDHCSKLIAYDKRLFSIQYLLDFACPILSGFVLQSYNKIINEQSPHVVQEVQTYLQRQHNANNK